MQSSRIIATFLVFALGLVGSRALGQKKTNKSLVTVQTSSEQTQIEPILKDFGLVVRLDVEGKATTAIQVSEISNKLSAQDLSRIYNYFSCSPVSKTRTPKMPFDPVIIIEAAPSLDFGRILDFIEPLRRTGDNTIKIAVAENEFLVVPAKIAPSKRITVKPNPLTLVVQLEKNGFITINNDPNGSMGDLQKISDRLKQIFQARIDNGVLREGSNDLESTVHVKISSSRPFSDVEKLVDSVRKAGSDRIILYIESTDPAIFIDRKPIVK